MYTFLVTIKRKIFWSIYNVFKPIASIQKTFRYARGQYSPLCPNWVRKITFCSFPFAINRNAVPISHELTHYTKLFEDYTGEKIQVIFEIGCQYAQDSAYLCNQLHIPYENAWVFEAHPQICKEIYRFYPKMNIFNKAVFNEEKALTFHCKKKLTEGTSSILSQTKGDNDTFPQEVTTMRMDKFIEKHNIDRIDFLKLDVEGCNWEVLDGFGEKLSIVKSIHTEAEHEQRNVWNGCKHFEDIRSLLEGHGFVLFHFERRNKAQSDSFWINAKYLKN